MLRHVYVFVSHEHPILPSTAPYNIIPSPRRLQRYFSTTRKIMIEEEDDLEVYD